MRISETIGAQLARLGWTGALLGALALGGCDGDNLFEGDFEGSPTVASVSVLRSTLVAGEALDLTVSAHGPRPITSVTVMLRGAGVEQTKDVPLDPAATSVTRVINNLTIPQAASGTLTVYVYVTDAIGQVSEIVTGPSVTILPQTL